ncbi:hypothetical protein DSO57_1006300 [Entomophthora muscae]|uniref:Uncharacterized protein n=1 Tax=Entomophthora muscae TaxID=34485 RepID=A0ACC2SL48_9FUNG|nr:hypothetical protein DSO57_1006300 [Entomophthora muscae]
MGEVPHGLCRYPIGFLWGRAPWRLCRYPIGFSWGRGPMAALPLPDRVLMGEGPHGGSAAETPYSPCERSECPTGREASVF